MNQLASELEKNLISSNEWNEILYEKIPGDLAAEIKSGMTGGPIGIGFREDVGHFVLGCGQGPFVIWMEKEIKEG